MAERAMGWVEQALSLAAATGAALVWLSTNRGGEPPAGPPAEDEDDYNPFRDEQDDEGLPAVVEQAFERLGLKGGPVHERTEQLYAMYRLMKALGLSDAEIARLVMQQAGERLDEGLDRVRPTDGRPVLGAVEDVLVRAAEEADMRLNLHGDLIRRVREGALAARTGREEALIGLERGYSQGREQPRRILRRVAAADTPEKS